MEVLSKTAHITPNISMNESRVNSENPVKSPDLFWKGMTNSLSWVLIWTMTALVWQRVFAKAADGAEVGFYESLALGIGVLSFGLFRLGLVNQGKASLEAIELSTSDEVLADVQIGLRQWKGWRTLVLRMMGLVLGSLGILYLAHLGFWVLPMGMILGAILTASFCWAWWGLSMNSRWARLAWVLPAGFLISFALFQTGLPFPSKVCFTTGLCLWWAWLSFSDQAGKGRSSLGALALSAGVMLAPAHWSGTGLGLTLVNGILFGAWMVIHRAWCKSEENGHDRLSRKTILLSMFFFGLFWIGTSQSQQGAATDSIISMTCLVGAILWLCCPVPTSKSLQILGKIWPLILGVMVLRFG